MGTSLPPREANQFKLIVKAYETKQYKKGVKAADAILKRFPEHGETQAMKGLVLNCMEKKTEAYDLVRKGLKNDVKSHVCWHVYGLLYRSDRKYRDAIKCYLNALRIDPQNQQILKDLSMLQVQMRDRAGFVESRRQLLVQRPNQRNNWIFLAVAHHLNNNFEEALRTLKAYEGTVEDEPSNERYEQSELALYKVRVMEEAGKVEDALKELAAQDSKIVDRLGMREQRASLLLRLGRPAEARREYEELLRINPDNYKYFEGLQSCLALRPSSTTGLYSPDQVMDLKRLVERLKKLHPQSAALRRIPLEFLEGDDFASAVEQYICRFVRKGVPSLFSDLEPLYELKGKGDILDSVVDSIEKRLREGKRLPGDAPATASPSGASNGTNGAAHSSTVTSESAPDTVTPGSSSVTAGEGGPHSQANGVGPESEGDSRGRGSASGAPNGVEEGEGEGAEAPTSLLWLLFFKAQHHNKRGRVTEALEAVDEAIAHTPTVMDLYLVKARILQGAGDFTAAARLADSARSMDLSDRYLNSEAVQIMLRADEVEGAEKTAALFTKHGDQHENLFDMQCMWYELASGDSYLRQKSYGRALKNYMAVHKHYNDMVEDQFDFHTYCLRKMTLRAYMDMLNFEDRLHSFPSFCHGAQGLIQCYLDLHDAPSKKKGEGGEGGEEGDASSLSAAEKRKLRQKQRKAESKAKKEAEDKKKEEETPNSKNKANAPGGARAVDPDPDGQKLLEEEDKLGEANKHLALLLQHASKDVKTHELAFELASRRQKQLLCLQAVKRLHGLDPDHPTTHKATIRFFHHALEMPPPSDSEASRLVHEVIELERKDMGIDGSLEGLKARNAAFLEANQGSLLHRVAAAEMQALLEPSLKQEALQLLKASAEPLAASGETLASGVGKWTHDECVAVHHALQEGLLADEAAAAAWKERCAERFPYSLHFKGPRCSAVIGVPLEAILANGHSDMDEA